MTTCAVTDSLQNDMESVACGKPVHAKGLCATHYQRWRRTGDATKIRKAGRLQDPRWSAHRQMLGDDFGSERTLARWRKAVGLLQLIGADTSEAIRAASRPKGTLN